MTFAKIKYRQEIEEITREISTIERIDKLNSILYNLNWLFPHPYIQVIELELFEKLIENPLDLNMENRIFDHFAYNFLDLKFTITIIDGFYRKRPYLKEFIDQIEESVILCLQKDYSGAINLLIPVIEGSIRKYLISKIGKSAKDLIKISDLSIAFKHMSDDYVNLQKEYLEERYNYLKQTNDYFDSNQEKRILQKHRDFFDLFIKQLDTYLKNNLYKDTRRSTSINDKLNRHCIFHGLEKTDYSFRNYLRIQICINYLSWAFGVITKDCSILAEVDESEVKKKWAEYFKILILSESMTDIKSKIYGYELESYKKYIDKRLLKPLSLNENIHKKLLDLNNILIK